MTTRPDMDSVSAST